MRKPATGGDEELIRLSLDPEVQRFAIRSVDDQGHLSPISNDSEVQPEESDDDDTDEEREVGAVVIRSPCRNPS